MTDRYPRVSTLGVTGLLVTFGDTLESGANHAALAFRAALEAEGWDEVTETATSLVSVGLRFDPLAIRHDEMRAQVTELLKREDWYAAALPRGRLWRIPAAFGGCHGPQLEDAAALAGVTAADAAREICAAPVRVLTIGFAPGQPYLGQLPAHWDIPRQTDLSPRVPQGAIVVAIRQLIVFSRETPTGWRHVGQSGFHPFRSGADRPFALNAGDQVQFHQVPNDEMAARLGDNADGLGGATCEDLP